MWVYVHVAPSSIDSLLMVSLYSSLFVLFMLSCIVLHCVVLCYIFMYGIIVMCLIHDIRARRLVCICRPPAAGTRCRPLPTWSRKEPRV